MATKTLTELTGSIRRRTDNNSTNRHTDADLTSYVNSAIGEIYELFSHHCPDTLLTGSDYTTSSTSSYTLPTDLYKIRGVDLKHSDNDVVTLMPYNFQERNRFNQDIYPFYSSRVSPYWYHRVGDNLKIIPDTVANETLTVHYIPEPTLLTGSADTFEFYNGWEDYVIAAASIRVRVRDEEDFQAEMMEKQIAERRIIGAAETLDSGPPKTATNYKRVNQRRFRGM